MYIRCLKALVIATMAVFLAGTPKFSAIIPAASAASSEVYWGAMIKNHNDGDPSMPSTCVDDPPWSTTNHDACDPWTVWRTTISNKTDSLLPMGASWVQTDGHGNQQWADFTSLYLAQQFNTIRSMGAIPVLTWISDPNMESDSQAPTAFADRNIAANGSYTPPCADPSYPCAPAEHFNDYVYAWGQEAAAYHHPFFLRFDQEMNGWWFPWGVGDATNHNTGAEFIAMWKHVHNIFDCVSDATFTAPPGCVPATNVTWVWCPNIESATSPDPVSAVYPSGTDAAGHPYIDWAGLDGYNTPKNDLGNWFTLQNVLSGGTTPSGANTYMANSYQDMINLVPNTPIMLGEFASAESSTDPTAKATWIHDALQTYLPSDYPNIRAIIWYNLDDSNGQYTVENTSSEEAAWQQGIANPYYQASDPMDSFGGAVQDMKPVAPVGGPVEPPPATTNLLQNASFDSSSGLAPWSLNLQDGATGSMSQDSSTSVDGPDSAKVSVTSTKSLLPWADQFTQGNLALSSNQQYTVTFSAKASGNRTISAALQQVAPGYFTYAQQSFSLTTSWQTFTFTMPAQTVYDSNTALRFNLAQTTGTVWLDKASVMPAGVNLLGNASFDSSRGLSPWFLNFQGGMTGSMSQDSSTSVAGPDSVKISVTSADSAHPWYDQLNQANLALNSNQQDTVTFSAKASSNRIISAELQQSGPAYSVYVQQSFNLTTAWQTFAFTMPAQTVYDSNTALRFNLAQATSTVWFDNVSVVAG